MKKAWLTLVLCPALAMAQPWWLKGNQAKDAEFLPPDEAFRLSSSIDGNLIRIQWVIADGYYLYRSKFDISPESPGLALDPPVFPNGKSKTDEYFGTQEIYVQDVSSIVGYHRTDGGAHPLQIKVTYQGCAEAGLCYPPLVKVLNPESAASQPITRPLQSTGSRAAAPVRAHPTAPAFAVIAGVLAFFAAGISLRRRRTPAGP